MRSFDQGLVVSVTTRLKPWAKTRPAHFTPMQDLFRRAQRRVERKHFRDRMALLHHERERTKIQREMGQDPYLDTAE